MQNLESTAILMAKSQSIAILITKFQYFAILCHTIGTTPVSIPPTSLSLTVTPTKLRNLSYEHEKATLYATQKFKQGPIIDQTVYYPLYQVLTILPNMHTTLNGR